MTIALAAVAEGLAFIILIPDSCGDDRLFFLGIPIAALISVPAAASLAARRASAPAYVILLVALAVVMGSGFALGWVECGFFEADTAREFRHGLRQLASFSATAVGLAVPGAVVGILIGFVGGRLARSLWSRGRRR